MNFGDFVIFILKCFTNKNDEYGKIKVSSIHRKQNVRVEFLKMLNPMKKTFQPYLRLTFILVERIENSLKNEISSEEIGN